MLMLMWLWWLWGEGVYCCSLRSYNILHYDPTIQNAVYPSEVKSRFEYIHISFVKDDDGDRKIFFENDKIVTEHTHRLLTFWERFNFGKMISKFCRVVVFHFHPHIAPAIQASQGASTCTRGIFNVQCTNTYEEKETAHRHCQRMYHTTCI